MTKFVTTGYTQSGDELTPIVWEQTRMPTREEVFIMYRRCGGLQEEFAAFGPDGGLNFTTIIALEGCND